MDFTQRNANHIIPLGYVCVILYLTGVASMTAVIHIGIWFLKIAKLYYLLLHDNKNGNKNGNISIAIQL